MASETLETTCCVVGGGPAGVMLGVSPGARRRFHAIVDGTNGNTYLQPVEADFLNSNISVVKGEVAGRPGQKGKTIALDIEAQGARVEDVLARASKSEPAMLTGSLFN